MVRNALQKAGWLAGGMVLMGVAMWLAMPSLMLVDGTSQRGYAETLAALDGAVRRKPDWRVLLVNDYQKSTAAFGALERVGSANVCNPRYASRILADDAGRGVTAFMPLAIGVYEDKKGRVHVSRLNTALLGRMFGGTIAEVMGQAGTDLDDMVAAATGR